MSRLSIRGMMLLVGLCALILGLFAWLREEAVFYVTFPLLGAILAARSYRNRSALITGGAVGGICQGIYTVMVLIPRGNSFPVIAMTTGADFLVILAVHLLAGLVVGTLLYLAFRWTCPRPATGTPESKLSPRDSRWASPSECRVRRRLWRADRGRLWPQRREPDPRRGSDA